MKPSEYIRKGWIQGEVACNEKGESVEPTNPKAVCWCASGAITAAYPLDFKKRLAIK